MAVVDPRLVVVAGSPEARAVGMVTGEVVGIPQLRAAASAAMAHTTGERPPAATEVLRLGGSPGLALHVAIMASRLEDGNVLLDVEDRTEAVRVENVRRDFVVNVSHELKTPVGAISVLAETMVAAADDPEAVRRFSSRMQQECSRLSHLVSDIIELSHVQGTDALARRAPVRVDALVREAVDQVRPVAEAADIALVVATPDPVVVAGDHDLLLTAVRNLLVNAVTYSPPGRRVSCAVRRRAGRAEIVVTDRGIGIPLHEQDRVFERFYRVDPARSRQTGGTGLGLAIVKHIAESHRGDITLWSRPGQGSTFTIRLPEEPGAADPLPDPRAGRPPPPRPSPRPPRRAPPTDPATPTRPTRPPRPPRPSTPEDPSDTHPRRRGRTVLPRSPQLPAGARGLRGERRGDR
jgi:two-component system sensor histidine kinase SenX3